MVDLSPRLMGMVISILEDHAPECEVWAFGSRVSGGAKKFSDLDLAVKCASKLSLSQLGNLQDAFAESDLPIKVDVVDLDRVTGEFAEMILGYGVEISRSSAS